MSFFRSVLGLPAETDIRAIERLVERLTTSPSIEDRRDALEKLRDISRENQQGVGQYGLGPIIDTIRKDGKDKEIVKAGLEALINVLGYTPPSNEGSGKDALNDVGKQNINAFVESANNVHLLLDLLSDSDFYIRYHSIQLLTMLLMGNAKRVQEAVLGYPQGTSKLIDLLGEKEIIRNEGLTVLTALSRSHTEIQKILAFDGAFERILNIVQEEGLYDGGVIVHDCLQLLMNLLSGNVSNQNLFREARNIQRLAPLLDVPGGAIASLEDQGQRATNVDDVLKIVAIMVSGNNPSTTQNQTSMAQSGILAQVLRFALYAHPATLLRKQALKTLGDIVRGNPTAQNVVTGTAIPGGPGSAAQGAVMAMIRYMFGVDVGMRAAAAYAFQCLLRKNPDGQLALASTLTPPPDTGGDMEESSVGRLLLANMLNWQSDNDPLRSWFAAVALANLFKDNTQCKEYSLRVNILGPQRGGRVVTLLAQVSESVQRAAADNVDRRVLVGLMRLLIELLYNCPPCVRFFVEQTPTNVSFGLAALALGICAQFNDAEDETAPNNRFALLELILKRITMDHFCEKIDALRQSRSFSRGEQNQASLISMTDELEHNGVVYDYDFTVFYKAAYESLHRLLNDEHHNPTSRRPRQAQPPQTTQPQQQQYSQQQQYGQPPHGQQYPPQQQYQSQPTQQSRGTPPAQPQYTQDGAPQFRSQSPNVAQPVNQSPQMGVTPPYGSAGAPRNPASNAANSLGGSVQQSPNQRAPVPQPQPQRGPAAQYGQPPFRGGPQYPVSGGELGDVQQYKELIRSQDSEIAALKAQLQSNGGGGHNHVELNAELDSLRRDYDSAVDQLSARDRQLAGQNMQMDQLRMELDQARHECTQLQHKASAAQRDAESASQLREDYQTAEEQLRALAKTNADLDRLLIAKEEELKHLKQSASAQQAKAAQQQQQAVDTQQLADLQRRLHDAQAEIQKLQGINSKLNSDLSSATHDLDMRAREVNELQGRLREEKSISTGVSRNSMTEKDTRIADLTRELNEEREKSKATNEEMDDLLVCLAEIEQERDTLRARNEEIERQLQDRLNVALPRIPAARSPTSQAAAQH